MSWYLKIIFQSRKNGNDLPNRSLAGWPDGLEAVREAEVHHGGRDRGWANLTHADIESKVAEIVLYCFQDLKA
jgi:hypothetical protein